MDTRAAAEHVAPGQGSLSGHEGADSLGGLAWMKALVLNDGSGCDFVSECSLWLSAFSQGSWVRWRSGRFQSVCFGDCVCVCVWQREAFLKQRGPSSPTLSEQAKANKQSYPLILLARHAVSNLNGLSSYTPPKTGSDTLKMVLLAQDWYDLVT